MRTDLISKNQKGGDNGMPVNPNPKEARPKPNCRYAGLSSQVIEFVEGFYALKEGIAKMREELG